MYYNITRRERKLDVAGGYSLAPYSLPVPVMELFPVLEPERSPVLAPEMAPEYSPEMSPEYSPEMARRFVHLPILRMQYNMYFTGVDRTFHVSEYLMSQEVYHTQFTLITKDIQQFLTEDILTDIFWGL